MQEYKQKCFTVWNDEIEGRLDPYFYYFRSSNFYNNFKFEIKKIGNLIHYAKTGFPAGKKIQANEKGVLQIRPTNINTNGLLKFDKNIYIKKEFVPKEKILEEKEVLFNNTNSQELVGKSALFNLRDKNYSCSNHITRIRVKENLIISNFLMYLLNYLRRKQLFFNICTNWNNQSGINIELLKEIKIPLPPHKIQNQLAEMMNRAYEQKEQKEREAEKLLNSIDDYILDELGIELPEMKNKKCFAVWSDEIKGKRLDVYYHQPKFEKIEKILEKGKYKITTVKNVMKIIKSGSTPSAKLNSFTDDAKGIIFIRNTDLQKYKILYNKTKKIKNDFKSLLKNNLLQKNDVLMCMAGTIGITGIYEKNNLVTVNQNITFLRPTNKINPYFSLIWFNSNIFQKIIDRIATIATIKYVNNELIKSLPFPLPPFKTQNKIAQKVQRRMDKAEELKQEAKEVLEKAKNEFERTIINPGLISS